MNKTDVAEILTYLLIYIITRRLTTKQAYHLAKYYMAI
jgi:hypothetical protein